MRDNSMLKPKIELRSEKVRRIVGKMPRALHRWSVAILILITVILILVFCLVPFPYSDKESLLSYLLKRLFGGL